MAILLATGGFAATRLMAGHAGQKMWRLNSPAKKCSIYIVLDETGRLSWEARWNDSTVLPRSPLGLVRDDEPFDGSLQFEEAGAVERRREQYQLLTGNKTQVDNYVSHRSLVFRNRNRIRLALDLAASDEGVAFRYRFPDGANEARRVVSESTGFSIPAAAQAWMQPYHAAGRFTPAYEDFYYPISPGQHPPQSRAKQIGWAFPVLFSAPRANAWALITESGTDGSYCACHLSMDPENGAYRIQFPLPDEGTRGQPSSGGPEPHYTLPWTMPWRVIVMGKTAGDIATSTLITDLAPPSRVTDPSWVHPGRASWTWWSYPEGRNTVERYNAFSDFASKMGWEYTLFDGGWWDVDLKQISQYARSKNVMPLAWSYAGDFYAADQRKRKLDELAAAGVRGVKADFWCSDRQEAIAAMHGLFEDAAARQMLVDLHGCTLPRGWQRTWPNFISSEAAVGAESYFYEKRFTEKAAELNAVLPFTRNAVGPMDYTPIACSPKKYVRLTTAAHELATAFIFTSGIVCYAEKPEFFESLPAEAQAALREAPANWDESRCLVSEPGKAAVFGRRSGSKWFIAGINGMDVPQRVELDLRAYRKFRHRMLIHEAPEPKMQVAADAGPGASRWSYEMPARGGFILKME